MLSAISRCFRRQPARHGPDLEHPSTTASFASTAFFSTCEGEEEHSTTAVYSSADPRPAAEAAEAVMMAVAGSDVQPAAPPGSTSSAAGGSTEMWHAVHIAATLMRELRACRACGVSGEGQGEDILGVGGAYSPAHTVMKAPINEV
jgi:hypothetical protein